MLLVVVVVAVVVGGPSPLDVSSIDALRSVKSTKSMSLWCAFDVESCIGSPPLSLPGPESFRSKHTALLSEVDETRESRR